MALGELAGLATVSTFGSANLQEISPSPGASRCELVLRHYGTLVGMKRQVPMRFSKFSPPPGWEGLEDLIEPVFIHGQNWRLRCYCGTPLATVKGFRTELVTDSTGRPKDVLQVGLVKRATLRKKRGGLSFNCLKCKATPEIRSDRLREQPPGDVQFGKLAQKVAAV